MQQHSYILFMLKKVDQLMHFMLNNKLANYVCSNLQILYLRQDGVTHTVSLEIPYCVKFMDLFYLSVLAYKCNTFYL